jgi:2-dehydro-3-deoxygalactonokinase
MTTARTLIGVDWGSSRLRAFRIGGDGQLLERRANDRGVNTVGDGSFDQVLAALLEGWPPTLPVLMCGMVGSREGWLETAYQPCPAGADDLASALYPVQTRRGRAWIIGGVRSQGPAAAAALPGASGAPDVMRGEETQMIGVASEGGHALIVTPGTHSKWARMRAGRIEGFRTYMTGEMYEVLRRHSSLARLMHPQGSDEVDWQTFLHGIHLGLEEPALLHSLFRVRTHALFAAQPAGTLSSFLSGILIGSEVGAERRRDALTAAAVTVIADAQLGRLYETALASAGCQHVQRIDGDVAAARGLWRIWTLSGKGA